MPETPARAIFENHLSKAAGTLLLLTSLAFMVGCQGVSAAGSGQQQSSTLSLLASTLDFGSVPAGSSKTLTVTATNSGPALVTVSGAAISTKYFALVAPSLPVSVGAGQSITISIKFIPNAAGTFIATLSITSDASNTVTNVSLTGSATGSSAGQLTLNPASEDFGSVAVGTKQSQIVTLTNTGGSSVTISQASVSGAFQLRGIIPPLTLNASQSTTFTVFFTPHASGNTSGTVTITSDASNPSLTSPLSGAGVAAGVLGSNPTSLNFGSVTAGHKQALSETVTNTGGSSVTISEVGISGTGFSLTGITTPVTLAAGQDTTFTVTFAPQSDASASGNVTVASNASNPTLNIPLAGTGLAVNALGSNPSSLSFSSVTVGSNQSRSETVTNTGGSSVTISQTSISGTGFSLSGIATPLTLTAGQSATFTVKFAPLSASSASGNVTITSTASNPTLTIPLTGTGVTQGTLGSNPTSLSFGHVTVGSNQSLSETVTNTGGSNVTISQASISGTGFSLSGITTPLTLTAGQSATFTVKFAPLSVSSASGNVTITSTASNPTLTIPLSGAGTAAVAGQLTVTPTTLDLGSVVVGTSGTASGSLAASGASVTVTAASTNNSVFSVGGLSLPVTIPAGQSTSFTVTFSPQIAGAVNAALTFSISAQPATTTETLTGTGTATSTHSVNLSWNESTSSNIAGYNIYRAVFASACGSYAKVNSVLDTSTLYTDSSVVNGTSYCYASTAVDTSNEESGYSNIVSNVKIPSQ